MIDIKEDKTLASIWPNVVFWFLLQGLGICWLIRVLLTAGGTRATAGVLTPGAGTKTPRLLTTMLVTQLTSTARIESVRF